LDGPLFLSAIHSAVLLRVFLPKGRIQTFARFRLFRGAPKRSGALGIGGKECIYLACDLKTIAAVTGPRIWRRPLVVLDRSGNARR
jgi:hypothetical protein